MEQLAVAPQDEPRERFYKDFVQQIGASVKDKVYANHDSLLDLTSYIRITGELARFNGDTLLQTWELRVSVDAFFLNSPIFSRTLLLIANVSERLDNQTVST